MASENVQYYVDGLVANADLSAKQFYAVKLVSARKVGLATAGVALGILQNKPAADGRPAAVSVSGTSKAIAGGTFAAGDLLTSDAAGKLVKLTPADTNTSGGAAFKDCIATALEAAVANDIVSVLSNPPVRVQTA